MKKLLTLGLVLVFMQISKADFAPPEHCIARHGLEACTDGVSAYVRRLSDGKILSNYGYPESNGYNGRSPGLTCQSISLAVTKFNEELYIINCEGLPFAMNFCGNSRRPFYLEDQEKVLSLFPTRNNQGWAKLEHTISADKLSLKLIQGGAMYKYDFNKPIKDVFWTKPFPNDLQQVVGHVAIEFEDGSLEYYYGDVRFYATRNGILSRDSDELCQSIYTSR